MPPATYSLGIDFGTSAARALIVDTRTGEELVSAAAPYASGDSGVILSGSDPNLARQNPADYSPALAGAVRAALAAADKTPHFSPAQIIGIGTDATGSTPLPVDRHGTPLGILDGFQDDPAAQAWLWKDHTAHAEAAEITHVARQQAHPYLRVCGGAYSSEWFWAKILRCHRTSAKVSAAADAWLELSDYIPTLLIGQCEPARIRRNICAAGHKAMYHPSWGGLPAREFLASFHPTLAHIRDRFAAPAVTSDQAAGTLDAAVARALGLPEGIPIAAGLLDAHAGAVGSGCRPGTLVKIIGTSTCDCMVAPASDDLYIPGVSGIVPGSIIPGMIGIEAGQSAVGDIFDWFVRRMAPSGFGSGDEAHQRLAAQASRLRPGESGLLALDWHNGNRNVLTDPLLTGLVIGQTLHTTPPDMYRALIEATAFGALRIIERIEERGVRVEQVVACGGIAEKNPLLMQIYADVFIRPMKIAKSAQACALGAAVFGSVVGGAHANVLDAQKAMTGTKPDQYRPDPDRSAVYRRLYALYLALHDAFGVRGHNSSLAEVMKELIRIREQARTS